MPRNDFTDGIDRRSFLGGAAGLGAAAGLPGLPGGPGDGGDGFDAPEGEVPYVAARRHTNHAAVAAGDEPPRREPVWDSMPVDRWLRIEAANAAERRVNRRLRERGAGDLVRAGTRLNGNGELIVDVHVTELETADGRTLTPDVDVDRLRAALPSTARGRAVLPREHREGLGDLETPARDRAHEVAWTRVKQKQTCGNNYDERYRPVPGGASIEIGGSACATTCTPAWDWDLGNHVIVTAGHLFDDYSGDVTVHQPESSWWEDNVVGQSHESRNWEDGDGDLVFDAATIDASDVGVAYELAANGGYHDEVYGIAGCMDWRDIEDDRFEGDLYRLQGITSGRSPGEVIWSSVDYRVFKTDSDAKNGDSGGPHYKPQDGYAYIAGVQNHGYDDYSRSEATAMQEVEERFGIIV